MTATTGRSPSWALARSRLAFAVGSTVSGSITIQPVSPAMNVMFEMS
ncbi:MAG: hypothetical protein R2715_15220 [Ilumatobacteraceae bacterium]